MKFSDLNSIHRKFFWHTKGGGTSVSTWWAMERLALLKKHEFVATKRISFNGSTYFLATQKAHDALTNMRPARTFVRPLVDIDVRSFEHDRRVLMARLALEGMGRATNWVSERRLKSETALTFGLARLYQPDAIYWNRSGEPVAFELELSSKVAERYADKVRKYVEVIRHNGGTADGFKRVLFVVCQKPIFETLSNLTNRFDDLFKIIFYDEIVKPIVLLGEKGKHVSQ